MTDGKDAFGLKLRTTYCISYVLSEDERETIQQGVECWSQNYHNNLATIPSSKV